MPDLAIIPSLGEAPPLAIAPGPLAADAAATVARLLGSFQARHPRMDGFILHGSYHEPSRQLPAADIDIHWIGAHEPSGEDDPARKSLLVVEGLEIDFHYYFWGHLPEPQTMGLPAVVSLARCHVLWERGDTFSGPALRSRGLLRDPAWVEAAITRELAVMQGRQAGFRSDMATPSGCRRNLPCMSSMYWGLGLLSPIELRAPSASRKAMNDIVDAAQSCGVGWFGAMLLESFGCARWNAADATAWAERLDQLARRLLNAEPGRYVRRAYFVQAMRALIAAGKPWAAIWPLCRGLHACVDAATGDPDLAPEAEASCSELSHHLGLDAPGTLERGLDALVAATTRLAGCTRALRDQLVENARVRWPDGDRAGADAPDAIA